MEISWFEIGAQIINFFILLFALNKLFYEPVTEAMENRKERIFEAEKEADQKMEEAEQLMDDYEEKIANIESKKEQLFDQYHAEALAEKERLIEKYQEEAKEKRHLLLDEIEEDKEYFLYHLQKKLGAQAVKIAREILKTISSRELEAEIFRSFIRELNDLDSEVLTTENDMFFTSAKPLTTEQKNTVEDLLKNYTVDLEQQLHYQVDEDLIIGYELNVGTHNIHNNVKNYLVEITHRMDRFIKENNI